ncbi:hypothetical protein PR048_001341 [Dryococelus australis]|uniref:GAG-pre-integrase domain-containing protein n=1 Tax=Dryococelus australis TaxID=614101 RepID=A0ABQ9IH48_9NEOP|nr:hypothetical protein PR048_001341 [Dryococelus australis]
MRLVEREGGQTCVNSSSVAFFAKQTPKSQFPKTINKSNNKDKVSNNKEWKCFGYRHTGHFKKDCPNRKAKQTGKHSENTAFYGVSSNFSELDPRMLWTADSGATQQMTMRKDWFLTYFSRNWIKGYLEDVGYIPDVGKSLFSVTSAIDKGCYATLNNKQFCQFINSVLEAQSSRIYGLFALEMRVVSIPSAEARLTVKIYLQPWHERLGHQNKRYISKFLKQNGIDIPFDGDLELCDACLVGKMHWLNFGKRKEKVSAPRRLNKC